MKLRVGMTAAALLPAMIWAAPAAAAGWQGFYIGPNATAVSQNVEATSLTTVNQVTNVTVGTTLVVVPATFTTFSRDESSTSFAAGGQAGFLVGSGGFVAGLEGDITATRRTASFSHTQSLPATLLSPSGSTLTMERDLRFSMEYSVRARAGFAAGDNLFYVTGGVAGARVRATRRDTFVDPGGQVTSPTGTRLLAGTGPVVTTGSQVRTPIGWTAGLGYERRIGTHLSLGLEVRHTDLDDQSFGFANSTSSTANPGPGSAGAGAVNAGLNTVLKSQAISLRANWRF